MLQTLFQDGLAPYWTVFQVTITEAAIGFVWGNALALLLASTVLLFPRIETVVTQVAVVSYCLPVVAVGGSRSSSSAARSARATRARPRSSSPPSPCSSRPSSARCSASSAADKASLDVVRVYGGTRFTQLRKVRLIAALPSILNALQIAVPSAFLGAVLGEYMGAIDRGVGITLIKLQGDLDSRACGPCSCSARSSRSIGYGAFGLLVAARHAVGLRKGARDERHRQGRRPCGAATPC